MDTNENGALRFFLTIGGIFLAQTAVFGMLFNACEPEKTSETKILKNGPRDNSQQQVVIQQPQKQSKWAGYMYAGIFSGALIVGSCIAATKDTFTR